MKRIETFFLALVAITFAVSCEDDGGTSRIDLDDGAIPDMAKSPDTPTIIDLLRLANDEPVTLQFTAEIAQGNPSSTDIIGVYTKSAASGGDVYRAVLASGVTLPQEFTLTVDDIVASFSELNSKEDVELADVLAISARFTMEDGRVLEVIPSTVESSTGTQVLVGGTGTNISTAVIFTSVITYPVSCPTMLEGDYTATVIETNQADGTFITPQQVTITQPSAGTYNLSDGTAGLFGAATPIVLEFTDVCGEITVTSPSISFPGQVDWEPGDTTLDSDTGIITLELAFTATSCCGLPGIEYTLEIVPN